MEILKKKNRQQEWKLYCAFFLFNHVRSIIQNSFIFSFSFTRGGGQLHWLLFIFFKHDTLISYPDSFLYCSCMRTTPSNDADKMHTTVVRRSCGFVNVCKKKSANFVGHQEQEDKQEEEKNEEGEEE